MGRIDKLSRDTHRVAILKDFNFTGTFEIKYLMWLWRIARWNSKCKMTKRKKRVKEEINIY